MKKQITDLVNGKTIRLENVSLDRIVSLMEITKDQLPDDFKSKSLNALRSGLRKKKCKGVKIKSFNNNCGLFYFPPLIIYPCCE